MRTPFVHHFNLLKYIIQNRINGLHYRAGLILDKHIYKSNPYRPLNYTKNTDSVLQRLDQFKLLKKRPHTLASEVIEFRMMI